MTTKTTATDFRSRVNLNEQINPVSIEGPFWGRPVNGNAKDLPLFLPGIVMVRLVEGFDIDLCSPALCCCVLGAKGWGRKIPEWLRITEHDVKGNSDQGSHKQCCQYVAQTDRHGQTQFYSQYLCLPLLDHGDVVLSR